MLLRTLKKCFVVPSISTRLYWKKHLCKLAELESTAAPVGFLSKFLCAGKKKLDLSPFYLKNSKNISPALEWCLRCSVRLKYGEAPCTNLWTTASYIITLWPNITSRLRYVNTADRSHLCTHTTVRQTATSGSSEYFGAEICLTVTYSDPKVFQIEAPGLKVTAFPSKRSVSCVSESACVCVWVNR